jgi:hypothetical protein
MGEIATRLPSWYVSIVSPFFDTNIYFFSWKPSSELVLISRPLPAILSWKEILLHMGDSATQSSLWNATHCRSHCWKRVHAQVSPFGLESGSQLFVRSLSPPPGVKTLCPTCTSRNFTSKRRQWINALLLLGQFDDAGQSHMEDQLLRHWM